MELPWEKNGFGIWSCHGVEKSYACKNGFRDTVVFNQFVIMPWS
jgi:hypothetical protein